MNGAVAAAVPDMAGTIDMLSQGFMHSLFAFARCVQSKTNFLVNTAFYKKIWWKQWMETIAITMK